jgi:tetratricopeptide (TPR) repeat protein
MRKTSATLISRAESSSGIRGSRRPPLQLPTAGPLAATERNFRKFVFAIATGFLLALPLRAEPSDDETKALAAAQQFYDEGAFDLCNQRVAALLKKYPKTELLASAELLQARALYQIGRDDGALNALTLPIDQVPANLQADTLYWQGEALLDAGRWADAEQKFRALLALKDSAGHADDANLGLAWAIFKQDREAEAMPLILGLMKDHPNSPAGQQAQLLLAKIDLAKGQFKEAITALQNLFTAQPSAGLGFEANYWLGEAYAGDNQPEKAVEAYRRVTDVPQAFPKPLIAQANLGLGRAERTLNQFDLAATAYQKAYQLAENETARLDAFRAFLESARAAGQLSEAVATLQEFAKGSNESAPAALFAIGLVLAEDGSEDKAIGTLESLLVAYEKSAWIPAANDQLGRLYARAGKPALAIKALQSCIDASQDPALVRTARFQLGRVLYDTKDYAGAAAQFALISAGTDDQAQDASFNLLLTQAKLGKADLFLKTETDFDKRFPQSPHLKQIALAEGMLLAGLGKTDEAMNAYQKALGKPVATPDQKALLKALSDLQYQTHNLDDALETCRQIVTLFPNDSLEAAERGILISYELKKLSEEQAEQALAALAQQYEKAPGGAEAYFRLGEFYSFRQDYVKAQDAFQQLATAYPQSEYADQALFFAGQAAFQHQDYAAALALLQKVPDNSPFKPDARLWEGKTYQQQIIPSMQNFAQASAVFDSVLATEKSGPNFVQANLLKGECLFELGAQDPANYSAALDAFGAILKSKDGTVAERNEAAERSAKCLDKLGRRDEAMALYLKVLYGGVAGDDAASPQPPDFSWQIEAGVQAGMIRESQKDWRGAIEVYQRLEQIGGAHQQEFHDLIDKLRRDNYIYE